MIQDAGLWLQHDCSISPDILGIPVTAQNKIIGYVSHATDTTVYITLYSSQLCPTVYYENDEPIELNLTALPNDVSSNEKEWKEGNNNAQ